MEALVRRGFEVWVVDDLSTGYSSNIEGTGATLLRADVRRIMDVEGLPGGLDVVFHEAAIASVPLSVEDPMTVHDVNVNAALQVMNLCVERHVRRFVFASSAAVYGSVANPPAKESDYCAPGSPYGASKLSVENYMHAYHNSYALETVALRYFNVYGPRQRADDGYSGVISLFTRQLLSSVRPKVFGDGMQTRDFVHVTDVAQANLLAMESEDAAGDVFNVASGRSVSVLRLLNVLARLTGKEGIEPEFAPARRGDTRMGTASIEKVRGILGYSPSVELDEGLSSVVEHLKTKLGVLAA